MPPVVLDDVQALKEFVGREIGVTGWLSLTHQRIEQFAEATEDRQWIHLDRERAGTESPYGATIAHGFLTLSLVSYFVKEVIAIRRGVRMAVNYGLNRVRFPSPVRSESKIRARIALLTWKELSDAVEVTFYVTMENEDSDKPCCVAEWVVRYYH
jgi:acyl dehydratase